MKVYKGKKNHSTSAKNQQIAKQFEALKFNVSDDNCQLRSKLSVAVSKLERVSEKKIIKSGISVLVPTGELRDAVHSLAVTDAGAEPKDKCRQSSDQGLGLELLDRVSFQVRLRLIMFETFDSNKFLDCYQAWALRSMTKKARKKTIRSGKVAGDVFETEIVQIISLAAFLLPPNRPLSTFVASVVNVHVSPKVGDKMNQRIVEFFEGSTQPLPSSKKVIARKKRKPSRAIVTAPTATVQIKDTNKLKRAKQEGTFCNGRQPLQSFVSSKTTNSLLGRSSQRYVGSYFNSKKSTSTLFREVKSSVRRSRPLVNQTKVKSQKPRKVSLEPTRRQLVSSLTPTKKGRHLSETSTMIQETPRKKAVQFGNSSSIVAAALRSVNPNSR